MSAVSGGDRAGRTVVVLAFDGSPAARRAIDHAGRFLSVGRAVILTVWTPMDRGEPTRYDFDLDGPPDPAG